MKFRFHVCFLSVAALCLLGVCFEYYTELFQRSLSFTEILLKGGNSSEIQVNNSETRKVFRTLMHDSTAALTDSKNKIMYHNIQFWTNDDLFSSIKCISDEKMTSEAYSKIKIVDNLNDRGGVECKISAYSGLNESKTVGGDVFLLWAEQVNGDGRVAGEVIDNKDGSYTGRLKLFWLGPTVIKAKLGATLENFCIRRNAIKKYGNSVFAMKIPPGISATFANNRRKENTLCGTEQNLVGYKDVCNLTEVNDGSPWYCGRPADKNLSCDDIESFTETKFDKSKFIPRQNPNDLIQVNAHGELKNNISVQSGQMHSVDQVIPCHNSPKKFSWNPSPPNGFFQNKTWLIHCKHTILFNVNQYRKCLQNKTIALFGDSTVRQFADYFMEEVMDMPPMDLKTFRGKGDTYHPRIEFKNYGFRLFFKKHEMPHHAATFSANHITSVATEILILANSSVPGNDIVILLTFCSHMQEFPPERYREKMKFLVSAIKHLLAVKPGANVLIKGPHVYFGDKRWFDLRINLIEKDIIFEEFEELKNRVVYLDIWSITTAHNSENIHPKGNAFVSQIQQFMSYICSV